MRSSHDPIEDDLKRVLGRGQIRGAGFSERMAAGASARLQGRRTLRLAAWSTAGIALVGAAALLWFLQVGAGSKQDAVLQASDEASGERDSSAAAGNSAALTGPVLLVFDVQPEGEVFVDGQSMGSTRVPVEIPAGEVLVEVEIAGESKVRWKGRLLAGQWKRFRYHAASPIAHQRVPERTKPSRAEHGVVHILSEVSGARVRLEGREIGKTPLQVRTKVGNYDLEIRKEGYKTVRRQIHVSARDELRMQVKLLPLSESEKPSASSETCDEVACLVEPDRECCKKFRRRPPTAGEDAGQLEVLSIPWSEVFIDGRRAGQTPLRLRLRPGRHKIVLRNPTHRSEKFIVEISKDQTKKISRKLQKQISTEERCSPDDPLCGL